MKLVDGVYLPDGEEHLVRYAGTQDWRYQGEKLDAAMKYCKGRDVAVDVGGHCGLWSKELAKLFDLVVAFEPLEEHRRCFEMNVKGNFFLYPFALGEVKETVLMRTKPHSTGDARISKEGTVEVEVKRLDDLWNGGCDFLKIDTEGYEEFVLRGAENLLKHKPVVIVEQKPKKAQEYGLAETGAVEFLKSIGAVQREVIAGDYILSW